MKDLRKNTPSGWIFLKTLTGSSGPDTSRLHCNGNKNCVLKPASQAMQVTEYFGTSRRLNVVYARSVGFSSKTSIIGLIRVENKYNLYICVCVYLILRNSGVTRGIREILDELTRRIKVDESSWLHLWNGQVYEWYSCAGWLRRSRRLLYLMGEGSNIAIMGREKPSIG